MRRFAALALALGLLAALAPVGRAAALVECNGAGQVTITLDADPAVISTDAGAPDTVTVDGNATVCANLTSIVVIGTATPNTASYAGGLPVLVTANLGGGADTWTTTGTEPVVVHGQGDGDDITGAGGADTLTGGPGADTLTGGAGVDAVDGGTEDDTLVAGGDTGDTLTGDTGTDTLSYAGVLAPVIADLGTSPSVGRTDITLAFENAIGGDGDDTLLGSTAVNDIKGGPGEDTIKGGAGGDVLNGGTGIDNVDGEADGDTVADSGDGVSDTLSGGTSATGVDVLTYAGVATPVTIDLTAATAATDTVAANTFENAVGGDAGDTIRGTGTVNNLQGGAGDDTIFGGGDTNDILNGGADKDLLSYAGVATAITANLTSGSGTDTATAGTFEDVTGGDGDDTLTGTGGANTIAGGPGNDAMTGGLGNDTIDGGAQGTTGGDTVSYAGHLNTQPVTASLTSNTGGFDTEADTFTDVENLTGGAGNDVLTGRGSAAVPSTNAIDAGGGDDTVHDGGDGGDTLAGGSGTDTVSYAGATNALGIDLTGASGTDTLTASTFENAVGGSSGDSLTGSAGVNTMAGGPGNDTFIGGTDINDVFDGGGDTDTLTYSGAGSAVIVKLAGGPDKTDTATNIENAIGGNAPDQIAGTAGDNTLVGGPGDDTLTGGLGNDTLTGGGNTATGDTVSYADHLAGEPVTASLTTNTGGFDTEADTFTSVENLTGGAGDDTLTGRQGTPSVPSINAIDGGGGADTVADGGDSGDSLAGGAGTDTLTYAGAAVNVNLDLSGAAATDTASSFENAVGGNGADGLRGTGAVNDLDGGPGNDTVFGGGDPNDVLDGGAGRDRLSYAGVGTAVVADLAGGPGTTDNAVNFEEAAGGEGADTIKGDAAGNSLFGNGGGDTITGGGGVDGFDAGAGDDLVEAIDGLKENIRCGAGNDRANRDAVDTTDLKDCELPKAATPAPPAQPPVITPPADVKKPVLSAITFSTRRIRTATRVGYRLDEAAVVTFKVERAVAGRRSRGRCVRPTRANRRGRACTRFVAVRGSFTRTGKGGANSFRFTGRLRGRRLAVGRYRLSATALDAARNRSLVKRSGVFRIVRR